MWILQFDEEFFAQARKIWNKFGLVLRDGVFDFTQEKTFFNFYYHMRSSDVGVFEMTVKAAVAAIEIMHDKFAGIIDDLLKFYFSEIVVVK